jgi:hypothetical protein
MSSLIGVVGESGHGKSTAIENLPPESTMLINIVNKPLPFMGWKKKYTPFDWGEPDAQGVPTKSTGNYIQINNFRAASDQITKLLVHVNKYRPEIKHVVIDDYQYLMSGEFMNRAKEGGWEKFTDIGLHAWQILEVGRNLREDLKLFILAHVEDKDVKGSLETKKKMKTIGKMLDEKVTLEGYFSIVLFCHINPDPLPGQEKYTFATQTDGATTAKSPKGMFPAHIPNDLWLVSQRIDEYFEEGLTLEESKVF